jgi:hypothetical protein
MNGSAFGRIAGPERRLAPGARACARFNPSALPGTPAIRALALLPSSDNPKSRSWTSLSPLNPTSPQSQVASPRFQPQGNAQGPVLEERLERSGEDLAPALEVRQLLRIFDQATQEHGDGSKRLGGWNRPGMRAGDLDRRLARMTHAFGDSVQQQGSAGDGFSVPKAPRDAPRPSIAATSSPMGQPATPPFRNPSTRRSKSAGLRNGRTRRRRSIEKLGLIRIASFQAFWHSSGRPRCP